MRATAQRPSEQRTGRPSWQAVLEGQSGRLPRQLPSGQRTGSSAGHGVDDVKAEQLERAAAHVPSAQSVGWLAGQLLPVGHSAKVAAQLPSGHVYMEELHTRASLHSERKRAQAPSGQRTGAPVGQVGTAAS